MKDESIESLKTIAAFPLYFVITLFYGGHVFSQLWLWFIVPLGVPAISYAVAAGIALLMKWPGHQSFVIKENEPKTWWGKAVFQVFAISAVYLFGFMISLFA